mgnify:FL=1
MDTGDLSTESRELRLSETYLRSAGRRSVEQVLALFMGLLAGGLLGGASTLVVDRFPGRVIVYTAVLLAASTILVLVIVYRGARQTESSYLLKLDDEGLRFEQDGLPPVSIDWKEVERVHAHPGHGLRIESATPSAILPS